MLQFATMDRHGLRPRDDDGGLAMTRWWRDDGGGGMTKLAGLS